MFEREIRTDIPPPKPHRALVKIFARGFAIHKLDPFVIINDKLVSVATEKGNHAVFFTKL